MKKSERYTALFLIISGIAIAIYGYHFLELGVIISPDAGFMPFYVGIALTILSAIWLFTGIKAEPNQDQEKFFSKLWYKPPVALGLMAIYAWAMEVVGYIISTLIFIFVWMFLIEREKWVTILLVSTLGTAVMYTLFGVFLKVPIPKGSF